MQSRFWLANVAAAAIVISGGFVVSPTLYGQDAPGTRTTSEDRERIVDVERIVERATRAAEEAVKDIDVEVLATQALEMRDLAQEFALGGRPRLGVSTRDVTAEEAKAAGLDGVTGALVSEVAAGSAAAKAGLLAKDVIVSVDGERIRSARQLARVIGESPDGRALPIAYVRGTDRHTGSITPEAPAAGTLSFRREPGRVMELERRREIGPGRDVQPFVFRNAPDGLRIRVARGRLGVTLQPLEEQLAAYFGVKEGALVSHVADASAAARAGIQAGDVITTVNGTPVKNAGDVANHLRDAEDGKTVAVGIVRNRQAQTITVTLETPSNTSGERIVTRRQRFVA